jgi:hypothetical protein
MKLYTYVIPILFVVVLGLYLCLVYAKSVEPFGFSNGTLIQLATSHVPTVEDEELTELYRQQVRRDLIDMTGSP